METTPSRYLIQLTDERFLVCTDIALTEEHPSNYDADMKLAEIFKYYDTAHRCASFINDTYRRNGNSTRAYVLRLEDDGSINRLQND